MSNRIDVENRIQAAITALQQGEFVLLMDDEDRENEGDLIMAAGFATAERINFMVKAGGGLLCMPTAPLDAARLGLTPMVAENKAKFGTPFMASIGAAQGIGTGISAADRAYTVRVAADPKSTAQDLVSPGHVFPLCARAGGVFARTGHTEGAVDLLKLAQLPAVGVLTEVMNADGTMARGKEIIAFSKQHQIPLLSMADILQYRLMNETVLECSATARLPVQVGALGAHDFYVRVYVHRYTQSEYLLLSSQPFETLSSQTSAPLVRLHSACLTGDVFHSLRCDCGEQLERSLQRLTQEAGVLLYLPQEGRGIGLSNKIKAYHLQEQGLDTVAANLQLGFKADERGYGEAANILRQLGLQRVRLLSNNPSKAQALEHYGIEVTQRESLLISPTEKNKHYLRAKQEKLGHDLKL